MHEGKSCSNFPMGAFLHSVVDRHGFCTDHYGASFLHTGDSDRYVKEYLNAEQKRDSNSRKLQNKAFSMFVRCTSLGRSQHAIVSWKRYLARGSWFFFSCLVAFFLPSAGRIFNFIVFLRLRISRFKQITGIDSLATTCGRSHNFQEI